MVRAQTLTRALYEMPRLVGGVRAALKVLLPPLQPHRILRIHNTNNTLLVNPRLKTWIIESHKDCASNRRQLDDGKLRPITEHINLGGPAYHLTLLINTMVALL